MNEWMKHFGSYFKNSIYLWDFSMLLLLSCFSHVRLCTTPWTAAHQAPLSLVFSRQEHWTELPFPSPMCACMISHFSHVRLCATPWTAAHQAPLSMGFSRQEYWSGLPFPSPRPLYGLVNLISCFFLSEIIYLVPGIELVYGVWSVFVKE